MTLGHMAASPADIYQVLCDAASQDSNRVKASLQSLQLLEKQQGTFAELQHIAATRTVPLNVRIMAIIQFKNNALPHWKSRNLFTDDHRSTIRARTMSFLDEEDDVIADCNAFIVSKISRNDFPKQWPNLSEDLIRIIQKNAEARLNGNSTDPQISLTLKRSLKVLDQVIKELSAVKMPSGPQTMSVITAGTHQFLFNLYGRFSSRVQSAISSTGMDSPEIADDMEISHMAFKCLGKVMLWVWSKIRSRTPEEVATFTSFFTSSIAQFQMFCNLRTNVVLALQSSGVEPTKPGARCLHFLTRHVRHFGKMFRRIQQLQLRPFVALPHSSDLVLYYWNQVVRATCGPSELISDSQNAVYPTQFLVQGMVLFRESLSQWSTQGKENRMETDVVSVLSQESVEEAVRLLVTRFIPLHEHDLEKWMEDPEEWVNMGEKEAEAWEFDLRACAERVLMTLSNQYPLYVQPLLVQTFHAVLQTPTNDLTTILQKEALYCAIGRCAHRLKDQIDFHHWLTTYLVVEAQHSDPNYRIVKRRIAWVIGKWFHEECAPATSEKVWVVLSLLLRDQGPGSDFVVRLTAAVALKECVDTLSFSEDVFEPYLGGIVSGLLNLLGEADTLESKRRVVGSLNTIIERVEGKIVPFMSTITSPIPLLWETAETDYLFKASLLDTVKVLVNAAKEHSSSLHTMVVPLVQEGLKPVAVSHLDEDALELWLSALRNAVSLQNPVPGVPNLLDLLPIALGILSENLDLLGKILSIIEAYVILNATPLLSNVELYQALFECITHAMAINVKQVLVTINLVVQTTPSVYWAEGMHTSGLFSELLNSVVDSKNKGTEGIMTEIIHVFARMATRDPNVFIQLIAATVARWGASEDAVWNTLLDQWWRKFDNMSEPRHRKLVVMGLADLVSTARPEVMQRLSGEIFNMWLDVLGEMKEALDSEDDGHLHLYWKEAGSEAPEVVLRDTEGTLEEGRRRQLYAQDPVQSQKLTTYIFEKLQQGTIACGGPANLQARYMIGADPLVWEELQKALSN